jgi:hypothetical protein
MKKTAEEIDLLIRGTFNTEIGEKCLDHLESVFVDREMYVPGMTFDQVALRQGEANVIKKIIKEVRNGR